jgi:1-acyl-sn-glycerol-3-phosphate acyltransferase
VTSITRTVAVNGNMDIFRRGVEKIIQRTPVPVIPMAIQGIGGSMFSRYGGGRLRQPLCGLRSKARLSIGDAVAADEVLLTDSRRMCLDWAVGTARANVAGPCGRMRMK